MSLPAAAARSLLFPGTAPALLLATIAGIALQLRQPRLWALEIYGLMLLLALALVLAIVLIRRHRPEPAGQAGAGAVSAAVLLWLAIALLGFAWPGLRAAWDDRAALPPAWEGQDVRVSGVVAAMPRWQTDGVRFRFLIEQADVAQAIKPALPLPMLVDVAWYSAPRVWGHGSPGDASQAELRRRSRQSLPALQAGDRLALELRLRGPAGLYNPPLFDYEQWLWQHGIRATAVVREQAEAAPELQGNSGRFGLERLRQHARDSITGRLDTPAQSDLRERSAGVLAALVTGDQRAIDQDSWEVFRITGVAHLMAISGLHITMFAWFAIAVAGWIWRWFPALMLRLAAPLAALWGGLALATAYALFSGWGVPAQRTVLMLGCWVVVRSLGLRWPWPATLMLAAALVLLREPWALQQPGFWLSFVAAGILFTVADAPAARVTAAPPQAGARAWLSDGARRATAGLGVWARQLWKLQWRLTLVLAPLTIGLFGQLSWVGLIANLLAIPVVTLLTPFAMLGTVLPWLLFPVAWCMDMLLAALQWLASLPRTDLHWPRLPWPWMLPGFAGAVLLVGSYPAWLRLQGLICLLAVLLWRPATVPHGEFSLTALDVGQGSGVLLQTRRHTLVYDSGPMYSPWSDAGKNVVVPYLQAMGLRPSALMLSHRDSDHSGGAASVLRSFPSTAVYAPMREDDLQTVLARSRTTGTSGAPVLSLTRCFAGLRWQWDGVDFAVLYPDAGQLDGWLEADRLTGRMPVSANATSCVLQVRARSGQTALLTGDIGRLEEFELRRRHGSRLRSDLVMVPHHGSAGSSREEFVALTEARFAVVQAGFRNSFGHPHAQVVQRWEEAGARVLSSAQCGAIVWRSDSPAGIDCRRATGQRVWHRAVP